MTKHLLIAVVGATLFCSAPAGAQDITRDWDRAYNFANVKTFALRVTPWGNSLSEKRVGDDITEALTDKGWKVAPEASADAVVVLNGAVQTKHDVNTFYSGGGYGGWGYYGMGGMGMGTATTTVNDYKVGTLVADIFDAKTKKLIYRGSATDEISDKAEKNIKKSEKAAQKMFKDFPPTEKK